MITLLTTIVALQMSAPLPKERARVEVAIDIGDQKVECKDVALPLCINMTAKASFRCGALLFGRIDFGEFVEAGLKDHNFCRFRVELDFPDETSALLLLTVIEQAKRKVKAGQRIELTFTYLVTPKKG